MLLRGNTRGHPFNDGNKRTGFLLAAYYLALVGHPAPARLPPDDAVNLCACRLQNSRWDWAAQ